MDRYNLVDLHRIGIFIIYAVVGIGRDRPALRAVLSERSARVLEHAGWLSCRSATANVNYDCGPK